MMNGRIHRNRDNHYREMALYYQNRAKMNRCAAAVHLEADDDKVFWSNVFRNFLPEYRLDYITYSRTMEGNRATGCQTCLKYYRLGCLSKEFFICIDSDYRRLLQEKDIDIEHFIFQTYTYSFENHLCCPQNIDRSFEKMGLENHLFDFESFLRKYSGALYELFICLILSLRKRDHVFGADDFNSFIGLNLNDVDENRILGDLQCRVDGKLGALKRHYAASEIEDLKMACAALGLTKENAYRYFRGHNVYDQVVVALMREVQKRLERLLTADYSREEKSLYFSKRRKTAGEYLMEGIYFGKYHEMNRIEADTEIYKSL